MNRDPLHLLSERLKAITALVESITAQLPALDEKANGWQAVRLFQTTDRAGLMLESVQDFMKCVLAQEAK